MEGFPVASDVGLGPNRRVHAQIKGTKTLYGSTVILSYLALNAVISEDVGVGDDPSM